MKLLKNTGILLLLWATVSLSKQNQATELSLEQQVIEYFQLKFDEIEAFANSETKPIPVESLMTFIKAKLMSHWSSELTIKAIIGKKLWMELEVSAQQRLIEAYSRTMQRYLFETFKQYDGQKPIASKVAFNNKGNKGWLTVKLLLDNLPELKIDLKLYLHENQWVIYDFRFSGISFVKLKQSEYQALLQNHGVEFLIKDLNDKYSQFVSTLASKKV